VSTPPRVNRRSPAPAGRRDYFRDFSDHSADRDDYPREQTWVAPWRARGGVTMHSTDLSRATDEPLRTPSADGLQPQHPAQWWYWSGQLRGASGRRYGLQLAYFTAEAVRGLLWGQMAHWALVELDSGEFTSGSRVWLGAPRRIEGRFALHTPNGEASAFGGDGRDRLRLALGQRSLDLRAHSRRVVPHYDGRRHDYTFGGYTYYYSRPRMLAVGELSRGRARERVEGDLWFDRQYGDLSAAMLEGWQWLSLHLDDGSQLMIFRFNREAGERFAVHVGADGRARRLGPEAIDVTPLARWQSPRSGVDYPCAWRVRSECHDLEIHTPAPAQEMNSATWLGPVYWEGACTVTGSHRGVAYVELLGSLAPALARAVRPDLPQGLLGRALQHPVVTLALATAVGHVARAFAPLRPTFPEDQVAPAAAHITAPAFAAKAASLP
jgi:predicted secreted hydrolase